MTDNEMPAIGVGSGVEPAFTFSRWAGALTEPERSVVEYRRQWDAEQTCEVEVHRNDRGTLERCDRPAPCPIHGSPPSTVDEAWAAYDEWHKTPTGKRQRAVIEDAVRHEKTQQAEFTSDERGAITARALSAEAALATVATALDRLIPIANRAESAEAALASALARAADAEMFLKRVEDDYAAHLAYERTRAERAEARVQGLEEAVRGLLDHCSECGAVATWSQYVHEDTYYACDDHHGAMRGGYIRPLDDETETAARAALAAAPALCSCGHAMRDHTGDFALVCSVCGSHAAAPRPSHVPYQDGTWLDWRPVGELTDDELREQSQASLDFTNRALRNGQHGDDHALKVVGRGFEIGREQMRRAALALGDAPAPRETLYGVPVTYEGTPVGTNPAPRAHEENT